MSACSSDHFCTSDIPIICRYVEAIDLAERAAKELRKSPVLKNGKVSPWLVVQEKSVRAIQALSLRLRLSPQARQPNALRKGKMPLEAEADDYYERVKNGHDGNDWR